MAETTESPKKAGRPAKVECIVIRKIGVPMDAQHPEGMAQVGEVVKLDRDAAKKLQDAGAVKVAL